MDISYFDNNATTRVAPEVKKAMMPFLEDLYGNPSSIHDFGGDLIKYVDVARKNVAKLIGASHSTEIIFTSCGTESDNTAVYNALKNYPRKKHIITSKVEHPAILRHFEQLERQGYKTTYLDVDRDGLITVEQVLEALTPDTALVSLMWANNETGVIFPIKEIGEALADKDLLFHTDAVQAVGKIPINLSQTKVDMLSLSGHKIHAPKGIGALYVRRGIKFKPFIVGGHQERGRRAGTTPVPNIVALGEAAKLALEGMDKESQAIRELRDYFEKEVQTKIREIEILGHPEKRLPNTSNITFKYIEGEAILLRLSNENIAASSGSACSSDSLEPSHVLRSMGLPFELCHSSIRFSLSKYTTREEVDYLLAKLPEVIDNLRKISPFTPAHLLE
ncbi:MAG: cysteine desulfurase NifS [Deltaproteobacteria bacterium]|jgi:cysteine desulfurase|nr:cysteine desulfurase NifS [Deltaproteobacteria bacterium]